MPPEKPSRLSPRRIAGISLLVALIASVTFVVVTDVGPSFPFIGRGDRGPALNVHQNLVVDSSGQRFVFKIATVYFLPFYLDGKNGADPSVARSTERLYANRVQVLSRIKELGGNTIRVPLGRAVYIAGEDPYKIGGPEGLLARLATLTSDADRLGLKVMPSWWDSTGAGKDFAQDYSKSFPMMGDVVKEIGHHRNVVVEPWNEPNGIDWGAWEKVMTETVRFFRTEAGYSDLLILDTINYSWSFSPRFATKLQNVDEQLLGIGNLAFGNHRYANADTCFCDKVLKAWDDEVGDHVGTYPIVGTEYGNWNRDWAPSPLWSKQLTDHLLLLTARGFNGYGAFTWNWVDLNTMTRDDLTTLTPFGEIAVSYWGTVFGAASS